MNVAIALHTLRPGAVYSGSLTNNSYEAYMAIHWEDERTKPSWLEICEVPTFSAIELCLGIDTAADAARSKVAGDPLRAMEYDRARVAAEQFAAADYHGAVPAMVAAWAINGRTPQQAADSILTEAAAYTNALELLRTTRLAAKEQIRTLMANGNVEQAQDIAAETIAAIEAAVAGIGNNA